MTEPKKTTRRTTRTRSGSTSSAAAKSPFEFTTPAEDTSQKVQQAMASLEELATPVAETVAPPAPPEPNGSGAAPEA